MSDITDKARYWAPQLGHYGAHGAGVVMEQCADEIARLRAELAAVRADAERYRWLRSQDCEGSLRLCSADRRTSYYGSGCDEAIDAARGGQQ